MEEYFDLPARTHARLEIAVGGDRVPRTVLEGKGWRLRDPTALSRTPWTYRQYIERSKAEFSVAKHAYVVSNSGWFSERSVGYLASGRPVVTQDTGFSNWLRMDRGLIPFHTLDEACAAVEDIVEKYKMHCDAARAVVEEYSDARVVLQHLVERAMNGRAASHLGSPLGV